MQHKRPNGLVKDPAPPLLWVTLGFLTADFLLLMTIKIRHRLHCPRRPPSLSTVRVKLSCAIKSSQTPRQSWATVSSPATAVSAQRRAGAVGVGILIALGPHSLLFTHCPWHEFQMLVWGLVISSQKFSETLE